MREHRELGVYVDKLTKHIVTDVSEALGLIDKGKKNRWGNISKQFFLYYIMHVILVCIISWNVVFPSVESYKVPNQLLNMDQCINTVCLTSVC